VARADLVQRLAVGVVAVAAIVWLAVSVVDMHALAAAQRTASRRSLTPALLRKGVADTRRAQDLRPGDDGPLTERVYLYFAAGRRSKALAAAEKLARSEPRNRLGWIVIAAITRVTDPKRAADAEAHLRKLIIQPSRRR